jgi:hypothetical protein
MEISSPHRQRSSIPTLPPEIMLPVAGCFRNGAMDGEVDSLFDREESASLNN